MEGRKFLWLSQFPSRRLLCYFVASASLGCMVQETQIVEKPGPMTESAKKVKEKPPRPPRAQSCLAFGDFFAQRLKTPNSSPTDREQWRVNAELEYRQAVRLDPQCGPAYIGLARLHQDMGKYSEANAVYQDALKQFPKEPGLYFEKGMCQARQKQWDVAIADLRTAAELEPANKVYADSLGFTLARAGKFDESYACFEKSVGAAQAHYNLARMCHFLHEDEAGRNHLKLALQINPNLDTDQKFVGEMRQLDAAAEAEIPTLQIPLRQMGMAN